MLGIWFPISGAMQITTGFDPLHQLLNESCLYQPPFVVPQFVPWVRKENVHPIQTVFAKHVFNHLNGIMLQYAYVLYVRFANPFEQGTYTGFMHFAA